MARVQILGVPIDSVTQSEAISILRKFLSEPHQRHVVTPNNEMLVEATRNPQFLSVLQKSALNLPDSTGILWAAKRMGQPLPERVTGVDTVESLCLSLTEETPVFFLGAKEGVAAKAAENLKTKNPRLTVAGVFSGSPQPNDASQIIQKIQEAKPHLLIVAFGAPKQDVWIDQHLKELPSVRVAMGVGGTFDFLAGTKKRAPAWMQSLGLEWLFRLLQEPSRIGRIWTAVVTFPLLVIRNRRDHQVVGF